MTSKRDKMQARARARRRRRKSYEAARGLAPRVRRALDGEPMIAYGARCSWWDDKSQVATMPSGFKGVPGLPCCPHCGGVLFELEQSTWNLGVETRSAFHWAAERADYLELIEWSRGRCFAEPAAMLAAWLEQAESNA